MTSRAEGTHDPKTPANPRRKSDAVALRTADQAQAMVVATVQGHADDLLRVARRYSLCADDAHEAYQRALEIYVRHARRLEAASAHRWLFTVLKHEALAVRRQRGQMVGAEEAVLDSLEARTSESPEDRVLASDDASRTAAALRRLKPDEIRAMWLKASGLSYAEIMEETQWSYTKVNRCLAEGRASLARHLSAIEAGQECEQYLPLLSRLLDGEASRKELRPLRAHLKGCAGCRSELRALHERGDALSVVLPSGVIAGVAAGGAVADVPGLATRLYEAVATFVHERAVMSAIKVQAAVEAASTGKVAAVAASAAAVAGGGTVAATETADRATPAKRPAEQREAPRREKAAAGSVPSTATTRARPGVTTTIPASRRGGGCRPSAGGAASRWPCGRRTRPRPGPRPPRPGSPGTSGCRG